VFVHPLFLCVLHSLPAWNFLILRKQSCGVAGFVMKRSAAEVGLEDEREKELGEEAEREKEKEKTSEPASGADADHFWRRILHGPDDYRDKAVLAPMVRVVRQDSTITPHKRV